MSDIRKWLKIMESVPPVIATAPGGIGKGFERDATVLINPRAGGGVGRFMDYTTEGNAMIDIKGIAREFAKGDFSIPERDLQNGNDWFHMSVSPDSVGTSNDKPEFRPGDMVKIADVYGTVIGPGFGVFVGYGTTGQDCIVLFDGKQIVVPIENVASVVEQNAKDNFDDMDNDGNLSPMSLGSDNVKIEQPATGMSRQEPAMDQRDEFSKWMETVEEALTGEGKPELEEDFPISECGCQQWDCPVCFPDQGAGTPELGAEIVAPPSGEVCPTCGHAHEPGQHNDDGLEVIPFEVEFEDGPSAGITTGGMGQMAVGEDDDAIAAFKAGGGKVQQLPYMNRPRTSGQSFGSKHIGSAAGTGNRSQQRGTGASVSLPSSPSTKPEVAPGQGKSVSDPNKRLFHPKPLNDLEEEPMGFEGKPKSGKGVKLGDIVTKTEFKKTGGQNSPMTYGDENLDEGDWYDPEKSDMEMDPDWTEGDVGFGDHEEEQAQNPNMSDEDMENAFDMISTIKYMQELGLSKADKTYSEEEMASMPIEQLKQCHAEVIGEVAEAARQFDTKTKTKTDYLDDFDDILSPRQDNLPANVDPEGDDMMGDTPAATLPSASRATTQDRLRGMTPSDTMRDMMNRINSTAGADEPALPDQPENELVIRTARDVPSVVSNAMQVAGVQSPEWHTVNNLPGYQQQNIRGMGRQLFSMFTSTPLESIQTIANVDGQGPNTDAEVRAVAGFLRDNAEDLGRVDVSHGMAIPGYKPDVKEYRANGIRFQVVRDPMGQYIYAYPDKDARLQGPGQGQGQLPGRAGGNMPRLRESTKEDAMTLSMRPTLFEQLKWDEEINTILKETIIDEEELDESSLSKLLGKERGGQNLVHWLHRKHKLGNEANLQPAPFSERLLWKEFKSNPDNFVVVSAANGVAGVKPHEEFIRKRTEEFRKKGKEYNPAGDSTLPYQIIAFTDDGQQVDPNLLRQPVEPGDEPEQRHPDPTVMKARMGKISGRDMQNPNNTFNLLADQIGALKTVWVASGAVEREKMKGRADSKATTQMTDQAAMQKVFNRVRPVLKTLANQALLHINNRAKRYIEGGNFEAAQKVAASGQKLKEFLVAIDTSGDINLPGYGTMSQQIKKVIADASGHPAGTPEFREYMNSAANGNAMQLKPILDALRDNLVNLA